MSDAFNPYREWLGLEGTAASPDFYQLLGVERDAPPERVKRAADYAINRVRSVRPGSQATEWTRLIDELRTAQNVLIDPQRRAAYDAMLSPLPNKQPASPAADHAPVSSPHAAYGYPPGAAPVGYATGAPQAGMASYHYADPMAPVAMPAYSATPGATAPMSSPAAPLAAYAPVNPATAASPAANIPFARPVGAPTALAAAPAHMAYHVPSGAAPQASIYGASAAAVTPAGTPPLGIPASTGLAGLSPAPQALPAAVKIPRRRSSWVQHMVLGVVAAAMIAAVVVALNAGLNKSGDDPDSPGPVAQNDAPAATNSNAANSGRTRPFRPPANSDLPSLPGVPPVIETSIPVDDATSEMAPEQPSLEPGEPSPPASATPAPADPAPAAAPAARREPTEAEQAQTKLAIETALADLRRQDFVAAESQLAQVESLPKTPEDEKMYSGARQLAQGARDFADALVKGFAGLKAEQEISFNSSTVKVKEATPAGLTIEVAGVTRKYTPENVPLGLKYGILNTVLPPEEPANLIAKAAWHATHPGGDPAEARHFLEEAQAAGGDVEGVLALLDQTAASPVTVAAAPQSESSTPSTIPQPAPATPPASESPAAPTPKELQELTRLAQTARIALEERNLDEANELIANAEALVKLPEHREKITHLKQLAYYTGEFWRAVDESLTSLSAMGELTIGETVVSVVESRPNHLVIKVAGQVKRYTRRDMPGGLAMAVANLWFKEGDAAAKAARGALYAVEKKGDPGKARELWQEAQQSGLDTSSLLLTLDDEFDFTK